MVLLLMLQNVDATLIFPAWSIEKSEESISSSELSKVATCKFWGVEQFLALKNIVFICTVVTRNINVIRNIVSTGLVCFRERCV